MNLISMRMKEVSQKWNAFTLIYLMWMRENAYHISNIIPTPVIGFTKPTAAAFVETDSFLRRKKLRMNKKIRYLKLPSVLTLVQTACCSPFALSCVIPTSTSHFHGRVLSVSHRTVKPDLSLPACLAVLTAVIALKKL